MRGVNTGPGTVMGTVLHVAEQARALRWTSAPTLVVRRRALRDRLRATAVRGRDGDGRARRILHREACSLLLHREGLPERLERIVEKAPRRIPRSGKSRKDVALDLKRLRQRLDVEAEIERSVTPERSSEERRVD